MLRLVKFERNTELPRNLSLAAVEDGDLVATNWAYGTGIGIKGSRQVGATGHEEKQHIVLLLADRLFDRVAGPFVVFDIYDDANIVALGSDWSIDFDPSSIDFEGASSHPLGALEITSSGLRIKCHSDNGNHSLSLDGQLKSPDRNSPVVHRWRLMHKASGDKYRKVLAWPIKKDSEKEQGES